MAGLFGSDGAAPFSNPLLRAIQIAGALGMLPHQRRAQVEHDEDRQREHQAEDLKTRLLLNSAGAIPALPRSVESGLDEALGPVKEPRMRVSTSAGDFNLPTADESLERQQRASSIDINLSQRLPGVFPGDKLRVPRTHAIQALRELDEVQRKIKIGVSPDLQKLLNLSSNTIDLKPGELPGYINSLKPEQKMITDAAGHGHNVTTDTLSGRIIGEDVTAGAVGKPERAPLEPTGIPEIIKARAAAVARQEVGAGFRDGKRETQEWQDAVAAKAQEYVADGVNANAAKLKALQYYASGKGKGAVERYEKLEDSDAYKQAYQRHLESYYSDWQKSRGAAARPAPPAATGLQKGKAAAKQPVITVNEALQRYQAVPPAQRAAARQAFIKQRGVDPETLLQQGQQ